MRDQAAALRERLRAPGRVAQVWAVATLGERSALAFAREIEAMLAQAKLRVRLFGDATEDAAVVLLPAGEGLQGVRRAYMRGSHTWLLLSGAEGASLGECEELLRELADRSLRSLYLALSGVGSVQEGQAAVRAFGERIGRTLPYSPEPFGFYGPSERGALTLAPAVLRRFFSGGR